MKFNLQPILENEKVTLFPLKENDFEGLYHTASDPIIWEQHPNKDRYKQEVFKTFFEGAIKSKGAFKIVNKKTEEIIGSTRFYDYNPETESILIGYTFYAVKYWGKGFNHAVKTIMLNYIFQFVVKVIFHVGAQNIRSQKAMEKLGAEKIAEQEVAYFGEATKLNFVYEIKRGDWLKNLV
jgi:RimJ/RimL family protein N-acetyltransferase